MVSVAYVNPLLILVIEFARITFYDDLISLFVDSLSKKIIEPINSVIDLQQNDQQKQPNNKENIVNTSAIEVLEPQLNILSKSATSKKSSDNPPTRRKNREPIPTAAAISPAITRETRKRKPKTPVTPTTSGSKRRSRKGKNSN
jgi:hypothetical protein